MTQTAQHGGPRPKQRDDDHRGGARRGAGALVRRLQLDKGTAQMLRTITLARRGATGNQKLQPVDVVAGLICAAYANYEEGLEHHGVA